MMLLAPPRLSMMMLCPSASLTFGLMMRAVMSVGPPAGNGTIRRTGLTGYAGGAPVAAGCACAVIVAAHSTLLNAKRWVIISICF